VAGPVVDDMPGYPVSTPLASSPVMHRPPQAHRSGAGSSRRGGARKPSRAIAVVGWNGRGGGDAAPERSVQ
jgi:hypothetical protein